MSGTDFSALSHLECSRTGAICDADTVQGTSSVGAPFLARYDLERVAATVTLAEVAGRAPNLWRYHELLPVHAEHNIVCLGEGMTPLLELPTYGAQLGVPDLRMKDEGLLPSGTFKARGAAVGVSRAAELGVKGIAMPTNGNAGAAWSLYAARAGLRSLIAMPMHAPEITQAECVVAGAELYFVDGLIGEAGALIAAAVAEREDQEPRLGDGRCPGLASGRAACLSCFACSLILDSWALLVERYSAPCARSSRCRSTSDCRSP
ncbi:MAG: threonine synthase [Pseudonocardiales bacterium]|jgi:threonine synthase|nr:threonine synthase [Pseudonocardiales bacterium]